MTGSDYEENLEQLAYERSLQKKLGLLEEDKKTPTN